MQIKYFPWDSNMLNGTDFFIKSHGLVLFFHALVHDVCSEQFSLLHLIVFILFCQDDLVWIFKENVLYYPSILQYTVIYCITYLNTFLNKVLYYKKGYSLTACVQTENV